MVINSVKSFLLFDEDRVRQIDERIAILDEMGEVRMGLCVRRRIGKKRQKDARFETFVRSQEATTELGPIRLLLLFCTLA